MNIQEFLSKVEGFNEVIQEREILKQVYGDFTLPKDYVENFVSLLHPKFIDVKVSEIIEETSTTKTIRFSPKDGYLPPFRAGQYVSLKVKIGKILTGRSFTISSPPHIRGFYDITVRRVEEGFVSQYLLDDVKIGDEFEISGPAGSFYHEPLTDGNELVFIGGGSGITPFRSIVKEVIDRSQDFKIWLIYGSRTADDIIFEDEFNEISKNHQNIKYQLVVSEPPDGYSGKKGFITADVIKEVVGDVKGKTFYLCGPDLMYSFVVPEIEKLKVAGRKIKKEAYGPPTDITKEPGWPKDVSPDKIFKITVRGEKTIDAKAGEPILNSLERASIVAPYVCRSGECSYCRTKIHSGKAFMPDRVPIRESDRWYDYIHSCMAYPLSDMEISY